jgi:hypothetical protein
VHEIADRDHSDVGDHILSHMQLSDAERAGIWGAVERSLDLLVAVFRRHRARRQSPSSLSPQGTDWRVSGIFCPFGIKQNIILNWVVESRQF